MTASGVRAAMNASPEASPPVTAPKKPSTGSSTTSSTPPENQPRSAVPHPPPASKPSTPLPHRPASSSSSSSGGEVIGDYALGETIGKGTFGKVKLGLHLVTGEKVAVKILEKKRIIEVADVERVAREIKILKRNRHVNVIQLYEVIDAPERIFLIMEHVDSGEMFEYIVAHHRIREHDAVVLFQQIVDGLDYLHANDVTHRDLKPENLLLQSCPSMPTGLLVKIVDFGLSNTHDGGRLLRTACGSPCYAAPEMIQGKLYKGPVADIWSLGVVLFAMVCGYLPFEDSNTNLLYKKILSADYKLPPFLSHAVQDLIRRILETNPEKRVTVEMIRAHPWVTGGRSAVPRALLRVEKGDDLRLRGHILSQLATVGVDPDDVLHAIDHKIHNRHTAAYYLLYNKLVRTIKDPPLPTTPTATTRPQVDHTDKTNGTPRRPELTAEEIRTPSSARVPVKAPGSATAIAIAPSTPDSSQQPRRRGSDNGAARPPSQGSSTRPPNPACTPTPSDPQHLAVRRPSSVRSGRNLVFLTNGGPSPSIASVQPQRPQPPTISSTSVRPPSQGGGGGGHRVSISNGMVALSPLLPQPQPVHRRPSPSTEPPLPSSTGRRATFIDIKASSPHALAAAAVASSSGNQLVQRRHRFSTITPPPSHHPPTTTTTTLPSSPHPPPTSLKEDDTRMAVDLKRIPPTRPPPQPRPPSSGGGSTQ